MDPLNGNKPAGLSWLSSFRRTCSLEPHSVSLGDLGPLQHRRWLVMGISWAGSVWTCCLESQQATGSPNPCSAVTGSVTEDGEDGAGCELSFPAAHPAPAPGGGSSLLELRVTCPTLASASGSMDSCLMVWHMKPQSRAYDLLATRTP